MHEPANSASAGKKPSQHAATATEFDSQRESALDVEQPVGQAIGDFSEQEAVLGKTTGGAVTLPTHLPTIEHDDLTHERTMASVREPG